MTHIYELENDWALPHVFLNNLRNETMFINPFYCQISQYGNDNYYDTNQNETNSVEIYLKSNFS